MEQVDITRKQVLDTVDKLNGGPKKCLNFKIPYEVLKSRLGWVLDKQWAMHL